MHPFHTSEKLKGGQEEGGKEVGVFQVGGGQAEGREQKLGFGSGSYARSKYCLLGSQE